MNLPPVGLVISEKICLNNNLMVVEHEQPLPKNKMSILNICTIIMGLSIVDFKRSRVYFPKL